VEIPSWAKKTWAVLKVVVGASGIAVLSALLKLPAAVVSFFQRFMVEPLPPGQTLQVSFIGQVILIGVAVAVVALGVWVIELLRARPDGLSEASELFDAIATRGSEYLVHDVVVHTKVAEDYSVSGTSEYTVEAVGSELYAIAASRSSPDVPCPDVADVRFKAQPINGGGDIIAVIAGDDPSEKRYLVFFDPPIKPAEKRRIRTSHSWPGSAKKTLGENKLERNSWRWPPRCKSAVNSVKLSIDYPPDGRRYETKSSMPPASSPNVTTGSWSAEFKNVPPGTEIALRTRRCT
jgi:hypothetical protein